MLRVFSGLRFSFLLCASLGLSGLCGCGHMVESRVIAAFATALETNDVATLRETTTGEFQAKALRGDRAVTAMKINLNVPTANLKVVKVVDETDDSKRVQVEVGETGQDVWYRLRQESQGVWVVDDVFLDKKELANGQSVAARLDLILSLQGFLEVWAAGEEANLRNHMTSELSDLLFQLPESERRRMMARLTGETVSQENLRPDLILREETAECRLSRTGADLSIFFARSDGKWLVTDLAVDSRKPGEDIASVRDMSRATLAAIQFHLAYAARDKEGLQRLASRRFFEGSLMAADLSIVSLPALEEDADGPEVTVEGKSASFLLQTPKEVVRFGLLQDTSDSGSYRVDEVTLYELDGRQARRLSAAFTAHAVMLLFHDALVKGNLKELKLNASHDFNTRVWNRLTPEVMSRLPLGRVPTQPVEVITAVFQGPVTSITLASGDQPLTYVLRDEQGKVLVDDVLVPTPRQPESLKVTSDILIPAIKMLDAVQASAMPELRGQSSRDFNRMVWNQIAAVPDLPVNVAAHLRPGLGEIVSRPNDAVVTFGDQRFGARILLVKEGEAFRVNDIEFIRGVEPGDRELLKPSLRARIQNGEFTAPTRTALAPEE